MDDRISEFPIPILHHIICYLSQKEAVRTCVLSKKWRHIGSTRPNLDFSEEWFDNTQEKSVSVVDQNCSILQHILFLLSRPWRHKGSTRPNKGFNTTQQNFVSVVNRTLQGYCDRNLSIHKLYLDLSWVSRPVVSLLDKWIPIIAALNIKALKLTFLLYTPAYYYLPSAVLATESLEELHLSNCRLSPVESVRFKSLRTLTLDFVEVDGGTLEKITWGCSLLRRLVLTNCCGLRNVRLSETTSPGLKHFVLRDFERIEGRSIEIDVPNLETVSIQGTWTWSHRQSTFLFSRLTILHLYSVILSSESFDLLSFGCPTLAILTIDNCSGFEEFHLASDSVKWLSISTTETLLKGASICAANVVYFMFTAHITQVLDTFSFTTTTSKKWYSYVSLSSREVDPDFDVNWWFLNLRRMLKALSGSRISLSLEMDGGPLNVPCNDADCNHLLGNHRPVVVDSLEFSTSKCRTASWYSGFVNGLFRVCRPRHIWCCRLVSKSARNKHRLSEFQFNILLANESLGTEPFFWRHDLEQVHVKTVNEKIWQLVQWTNLLKLRNRTYDGIMCLELKWRGQKTT
ncbi:F-box family protein [Striga asiatica]|uniref:F-box family protein n=1 Tax=Striga asiatica TaxID=4170 RepID=A0A5A7QJX5_STRAF|nr:F-box family protein [Striga asiatica]